MKIERKLNKMYAGAIALMMVSIIFASVFATRTFTDSNDTWTGTIVQSGNLDFKSGSYFNLSKKIVNSKGHVYNASAANAQAAVYDLGNTTGWVDFNRQNITLTSTLKLGTNCEIRNFHFYLGTSASVTMIMNHDLTNGNNGIYIHDGYLNGNGINQPNENSSFLIYDQPCGIFLLKCSNSTVCDITIYNTMFGGVGFQQSKNNIIKNVKVFYAGLHHMVASYTPGDCYSAGGISLFNCSDGLIDCCITNHTWSYGICLEGFLPCPVSYRTHHSTISNCIVSNTTIGIYVGEDCSNSTVENCFIKDGKMYNAAYALSWAVGSNAVTSDGLRITDCTIDRWDNGIGLATNNLTISGLKTSRIDRYTMELTGKDIIISDCSLKSSGGYQIYLSSAERVSINGNNIYGGGNGFDACILSSTKNVTFSGNHIRQRASGYPYNAIRESGTADWTRCDASNSFNCLTSYPLSRGVKLIGTHSYNIMVNGTTAKIGVNTSAGITWK